MRKYICLVLSCSFLICACSKDKKHCYECEQSNPGQTYSDVGCYTNDEWDDHQVVDFSGNIIDKKTKCRKK